jgi:hypothetical protein
LHVKASRHIFKKRFAPYSSPGALKTAPAGSGIAEPGEKESLFFLKRKV